MHTQLVQRGLDNVPTGLPGRQHRREAPLRKGLRTLGELIMEHGWPLGVQHVTALQAPQMHAIAKEHMSRPLAVVPKAAKQVVCRHLQMR